MSKIDLYLPIVSPYEADIYQLLFNKSTTVVIKFLPHLLLKSSFSVIILSFAGLMLTVINFSVNVNLSM